MRNTNVKGTNASRALYNELNDSGQYGNDVVMTDSYLRLEASLQGTLTNINFNVLVNSGAQNCTEKRLAITDCFVASQLSFMIYKAGASTAATAAEISVSQLRTYPNPRVFTGTGEADNLHSIYNGYARIVIDGKVYVDSIDMERFYRVPTAQKGLAWSSVATTGIVSEDGFENMNYGFSPLTPTIKLNGRGKNEISIQLAAPALTSGTSSQNFIVCYMRGLLLQNAAKNH